VVNKSVTAKVKKVKNELATSLWRHYTTQLLIIYVKQEKGIEEIALNCTFLLQIYI